MHPLHRAGECCLFIHTTRQGDCRLSDATCVTSVVRQSFCCGPCVMFVRGSMPPLARPFTWPLRAPRHTCIMVHAHTVSHAAASRTNTLSCANTLAPLLSSRRLTTEEPVRGHPQTQMRWKQALSIPTGAHAFVDATRCSKACTSCTDTVSSTTHSSCLHSALVWWRRQHSYDPLGHTLGDAHVLLRLQTASCVCSNAWGWCA